MSDCRVPMPVYSKDLLKREGCRSVDLSKGESIMSTIFFKCPVCGCKDKNVVVEDVFSVGDIVECPDCLNLLVVQKNYKLEDFKDILVDQVEKKKAQKKPKVMGKWDDRNTITVRCL